MWYEIIMLIIGAVIGVVASVGTMFAERALNRAGKFLIFISVFTAKVHLDVHGVNTKKAMVVSYLKFQCI